MSSFMNSSPALLYLVGALVLTVLPKTIRNFVALAVGAVGIYWVHTLQLGTLVQVPFMEYNLTVLRVDTLSKVFGYIFTMTSFTALLYGFKVKTLIEPLAALLYVGAALGVVFSGDLITLYFFWETMAVASAFLILAKRTEASMAAGKRYILVHIVGGLVLLAGIVLTIAQTGSIAFEAFSEPYVGHILILLGFMVNAAAFPFWSWLPDAYPEATVFGSVVLSAFTSKTAVYTLIRGFAGWEVLIWSGCIMALVTIVYALLENNIRRVLSYSIVNQVGFMLVAIGIGSRLALAAAAAHAFCHILYKSLLFMSTGAAIQETGKERLTDVGGLAKSMPITAFFAIVGGLSIAAPFTIGFTGKPLILAAAEKAHLVLPWLILEVASAAVILHTAIKVPYFVFFGESKNLKAQEAPVHMLVAMGIVAVLCVGLGIFPAYLYDLLPNKHLVLQVMPTEFFELYFAHPAKLMAKLQMILVVAAGFFVFKKYITPQRKVLLDVDIFYRYGARILNWALDKSLNSLNSIVDREVRVKGLAKVALFFQSAQAHTLAFFALTPASKKLVYKRIETGSLPIGLGALVVMVFAVILLLL